MRNQQGSAALSALEVQQIRREGDAGTINVKAWASAKGVSAETIRKVYRRETYNWVPDGGEVARAGGEGADLTDDEVAASLARLSKAAEDVPPQGPQVESILDEIQGRKK